MESYGSKNFKTLLQFSSDRSQTFKGYCPSSSINCGMAKSLAQAYSLVLASSQNSAPHPISFKLYTRYPNHGVIQAINFLAIFLKLKKNMVF